MKKNKIDVKSGDDDESSSPLTGKRSQEVSILDFCTSNSKVFHLSGHILFVLDIEKFKTKQGKATDW